MSSRLLVYAGRLIKQGLDPVDACRCAICHTLTDEEELWSAMQDIVQLYFGNLLGHEE